MKRILIALLSCFFVFTGTAQTPDSMALRGSLYIGWGYNTERFSKSDIRFFDKSGDYDFTLHDMKAVDRPAMKHLLRTSLSVPQYSYRLGYFFPHSNWGIEVSFDHAKYIAYDYQRVRLTGRIEGQEYNTDTIVDPAKLVHIEHTNGANWLLFSALRRQSLFASRNGKHTVYGVAKLGGGTVIPKTDAIVFGYHVDNCFHLAGIAFAGETALRYEFYKHFYLEPAFKGVFADFNNVITGGDGLAKHHFWAAEFLATAGFRFAL
jgi:hypothetical protein